MIRVLVVDDSLFMRTMIRDLLEKDPDIEVVATAIDGIDALRKIDEYSPDAMTLDIEMPRMNGLEVLKKRMQATRFPKVLVLSSLTSEGAEMTRTAMALGADDFMLKPRDTSALRGIGRELTDKIHNLVRIAYVRRVERPPEALADRLVVIGASAGGPPMLDLLLSSIESPLPAAMVITQHMPEGGFTASLATRLNRISPMPVKETESGDALLRGNVYISKGGYHTVIASHVGEKGERGGGSSTRSLLPSTACALPSTGLSPLLRQHSATESSLSSSPGWGRTEVKAWRRSSSREEAQSSAAKRTASCTAWHGLPSRGTAWTRSFRSSRSVKRLQGLLQGW